MEHILKSFEKSYAATMERILKIVMVTGILAASVGGAYNALNGYSGWPVYVHVVGFLLLCTLLIFYSRINKDILRVSVFGYFCFVYTPFAWVNLMGLYSSVTYVSYVFFLLIVLLLDGKMNIVFSVAYFAEIIVLLAVDVLVRPVANPYTPYFPMAFSYIVMLCVLIFVARAYKKQIKSPLRLSHLASVTDLLTGLSNHRFLTEAMAEAEKWYLEKPGRDYAIAVVDLDDFKHINDEYGHSVGDEVLSELGGLFDDSFPGHIMGRYGGDEFVVLFQGTPLDQCFELCEAFRRRVEKHRFSDRKIALTFSIGLCNRTQIAGADLFNEADALMYAAKGRGKNSVRSKGTSGKIEGIQ